MSVKQCPCGMSFSGTQWTCPDCGHDVREAEIARLREELKSANQFIADLQHATGCRTVEDGEAMKEEFQRLQNRSFQCCFCGANCQTFSGLKIHSAKCEAHPQFSENELLRKDVERLNSRRISLGKCLYVEVDLRAAIDAAKEAE